MSRPHQTAQLEVIDASVAYDGAPVISGVGFQLRDGEIGCLLGPSGCGKTSVLRAIAGFEALFHGEIKLRGRSVSRPGATVPPEQRQVGMVFQDLALYPHLTVAGNVGFGLRNLIAAERRRRVNALLQLMGLESARDRYPHELSGGQQQRVALARAMAPQPQVLLLDEPFSGLDVELREQLAREVRQILRHEGITGVLVTHDQMEAFAMADAIGVLGNGRLQQWGTSHDLYHHPVNRFVADFIGEGSILSGRTLGQQRVDTPLGVVTASGARQWPAGESVRVLFRPDDLEYDADSPLEFEIAGLAFRGAQSLCSLKLPDGDEVLCLVSSQHGHAVGDRIGIRLVVSDAMVFPG